MWAAEIDVVCSLHDVPPPAVGLRFFGHLLFFERHAGSEERDLGVLLPPQIDIIQPSGISAMDQGPSAHQQMRAFPAVDHAAQNRAVLKCLAGHHASRLNVLAGGHQHRLVPEIALAEHAEHFDVAAGGQQEVQQAEGSVYFLA